MGKNRENINWQPVSFLPKISNMIDGMLEAAKETYEPLCQIKVHDDFTIKRLFEVTGQQIKDEWMYDEQLERWSNLPGLKTVQRNEVQRLQRQMIELKKVDRKFWPLPKNIKTRQSKRFFQKATRNWVLNF